MAVKKYYYSDSSMFHQDLFYVRPNDDVYKVIGFIDGSYHVLEARLFGLTYAQYLRYVRDNYNAMIVGKGHKYPQIYFKQREDCDNLVGDLTSRWAQLLTLIK